MANHHTSPQRSALLARMCGDKSSDSESSSHDQKSSTNSELFIAGSKRNLHLEAETTDVMLEWREFFAQLLLDLDDGRDRARLLHRRELLDALKK